MNFQFNLQKVEKVITTIAITYFFIGLLFAFFYALFYHWGWLSFFSPGYYMVTLTWPFQVSGFFNDFRYYGFTGKIIY